MTNCFVMIRQLFEASASGKSLYIRCAGARGRQLCYELRNAGIMIEAFLDSNCSDSDCMGIPILPLETIYSKVKGEFFILVAIEKDSIYHSIVNEYKKQGLQIGKDYGDFSFVEEMGRRMYDYLNILPNKDFYDRFYSIANDRKKEMSNLFPEYVEEVPRDYNLIPNLDLPLTTFCSMSCEYCSHCIPLANPPKNFIVKNIINDLDNLLSVSFIECLAIMGGEPFVYPKITEFIKEYRKLENGANIGFTRVVTNGTIVPSKEFFIEYCQLKNAYIYISNYGKKSKKIKEIQERADEYGVKTYLCPDMSEWVFLGNHTYDRNYDKKELEHLYAVCDSHSCVQLLDGHLYSCGRVPVLNEDRIIPYSDTDFCCVRDENPEKLKKKLHEYLYMKPYLEGCRYCDGQHMYSQRVARGE